MEASGICTMITPWAKRLQQSTLGSSAHFYFDSDRLLHSQTAKICNICNICRQDEDCYNFTDRANISVQCSPSSTGYQGQEISVLSPHYVMCPCQVLYKEVLQKSFSPSSLADWKVHRLKRNWQVPEAPCHRTSVCFSKTILANAGLYIDDDVLRATKKISDWPFHFSSRNCLALNIPRPPTSQMPTEDVDALKQKIE